MYIMLLKWLYELWAARCPISGPGIPTDVFSSPHCTTHQMLIQDISLIALFTRHWMASGVYRVLGYQAFGGWTCTKEVGGLVSCGQLSRKSTGLHVSWEGLDAQLLDYGWWSELGVCEHYWGVLVGKDDSLQISWLPLPLHTLSFIQWGRLALFCQELVPSLSAFPLYPEALFGNDRVSLTLSELKCKEKQGCLLAGSQGGPAAHLVLHWESFLAGWFSVSFAWVLVDSRVLSSCMWGWFESLLRVMGWGQDSICMDESQGLQTPKRFQIQPVWGTAWLAPF